MADNELNAQYLAIILIITMITITINIITVIIIFLCTLSVSSSRVLLFEIWDISPLYICTAGPVPERPRTSTSSWPRGWGPLYQTTLDH